MARPRKLTPDDLAAVQEMWLAGARRKIIANRFGVCLRTVYNAIGRPENVQEPVFARPEDSQTPRNPPLADSNA